MARVCKGDSGLSVAYQGPPCLPKRELPVTGPLVIDVYSDIHVGARGFLESRFLRDLDETLREGRYAVLNGDLFNAAMRDHKHGGVYEEVKNVEESLDFLDTALAPLVDADRILAITGGNHDGYVWSRAGIDPVRQLAARLRIADRYMQHGGWLWTAHGRAKASGTRLGEPRPIEYKGFVYHGTGNGASSTAVERVAATFEADYYLSGHTHAPLATVGERWNVYPQNGAIRVQPWTAAVGGSYLGYGGYALEKTLKPRPNGKLTLTLHDGEKRVDVRLPR